MIPFRDRIPYWEQQTWHSSAETQEEVEKLMEIMNHKASKAGPSGPKGPVTNKTPPKAPEPVKNSMARIRHLSLDDWELMKDIDPDLIRRMMANRFNITGKLPFDWMNANFAGLFYVCNSMIYIELEEDAVALKMMFEGGQ